MTQREKGRKEERESKRVPGIERKKDTAEKERQRNWEIKHDIGKEEKREGGKEN